MITDKRSQMLKGKRILITAGPTWVPVDRVRVIANVSSGATGMIIALHAAKLGADVTLLLGPSIFEKSKIKNQRLEIIGFRYFDELKELIRHELRRKKYDIIIHAAAVSDYKLVKVSSGKISSGKKRLTIYLRPAVKIIDEIRWLAKDSFLVMFKLEANKSMEGLIDIAYKAMKRYSADMAVANNIEDVGEERHKAYIIDVNREVVGVDTKEALARKLLKVISERIKEG